jgi:hypothetical protein
LLGCKNNEALHRINPAVADLATATHLLPADAAAPAEGLKLTIRESSTKPVRTKKIGQVTRPELRYVQEAAFGPIRKR